VKHGKFQQSNATDECQQAQNIDAISPDVSGGGDSPNAVRQFCGLSADFT
jgi:hypothetical protein